MQTTNTTFDQLSTGQVRPLSWQFKASFDKAFDPSVEFFTLDTSVLDGDDLLAPTGDNIVQEWDRYDYIDYSDRVVQMEWSREEDSPYSVNMAMADVLLNNYDNLFTRGSGSPLDPNLLPRRPIRLLSGFGGINLPQFVGLTETVPKVDRDSRTASVHCLDFLSYLFNKPLDETVMLENVRTDEVLDYLLQLFGLLPSQYVLDEGLNIISFAYWEKGKKLGDAVRELMQAELGMLYMDELGTIRFRNRLKIYDDPVMTFDDSNVITYEASEQTNIINVVEVKSKVREVQPLQVVYASSGSILIPGSGSVEVFVSFEDPVTVLSDVTSYTVNTAEDQSGTDITSQVTVDSAELFSESAKITFDNAYAEDGYISALNILGTPARVIKNIYLRSEDAASIVDFEEQPITIENDLIQDDDGANSIALTLLHYYSTYSNTIELEVKGNPALQISDTVNVDLDNMEGVYIISKIQNMLQVGGKYTQKITARLFDIPAFFILSSDSVAMSLLDGEDVLAP